MSPKDFAAAIERKRGAIEKQLRRAEKQAVDEAYALFVKRSSGALSLRTLRLMGHPYAVRDPQTPLDPSMINAQSKKFLRSWRKRPPKRRSGVMRSGVVNIDPKSKYFFGTKFMVARRIDIAVALTIKRKRRVFLRAALRRALRA